MLGFKYTIKDISIKTKTKNHIFKENSHEG